MALKDQIEKFVFRKGTFTVPEVQEHFGLSYPETMQHIKSLVDEEKVEFVSGFEYRAIENESTLEEEHDKEEANFDEMFKNFAKLRRTHSFEDSLEELRKSKGHPHFDDDDDDDDDDKYKLSSILGWDDDDDEDEEDDEEDDEEEEDEEDEFDWYEDDEPRPENDDDEERFVEHSDEDEEEDKDAPYDGIYEGEHADLAIDLRLEIGRKETKADFYFEGSRNEREYDREIAIAARDCDTFQFQRLPAKGNGYKRAVIGMIRKMCSGNRFAISESLENDIVDRLGDSFEQVKLYKNDGTREDAQLKFGSNLPLPDGMAFSPIVMRAANGKLLTKQKLRLTERELNDLVTSRDFYFILRRHNAAHYGGYIYVALTKKSLLYSKMMELYAAVCETLVFYSM